jgi:hypothetical protein
MGIEDYEGLAKPCEVVSDRQARLATADDDSIEMLWSAVAIHEILLNYKLMRRKVSAIRAIRIE